MAFPLIVTRPVWRYDFVGIPQGLSPVVSNDEDKVFFSIKKIFEPGYRLIKSAIDSLNTNGFHDFRQQIANQYSASSAVALWIVMSALIFVAQRLRQQKQQKGTERLYFNQLYALVIY